MLKTIKKTIVGMMNQLRIARSDIPCRANDDPWVLAMCINQSARTEPRLTLCTSSYRVRLTLHGGRAGAKCSRAETLPYFKRPAFLGITSQFLVSAFCTSYAVPP